MYDLDEKYKQTWAASMTLNELQNVATQNNILLPPKVKKIEIINILVNNNIRRSIKRRINSEKSPAKKIKSSKIVDLIKKQKNDLNEPTELYVKKCEDGTVNYDDLIIKNGIAIGKLDNGVLIKLDTTDVEKCIGERIPFDCLQIVGVKEIISDDVDVEPDSASEEE